MTKKRHESDEDRWLSHGVHPKKNMIFLNGEIDESAADACLSAFMLMDPAKPVLFLLNSPGGCEFAGMAIYDTIKNFPSEVTIRVVGEACSMAAVILQAGDHRQATVNSTIMTHSGSNSVYGHKVNVKRQVKFVERMDDRLDKIMIERIQEKHPDKTIDWWKRRERFDNWMFSDEALEMGLLDEIYEGEA